MSASCETCGGAVEIRSTHEGTNHYVPVERGRIGEKELVKAESENARLQARLEEAEAQVAIMAAGYDHAADEVRFDKHQRGFEAALQLYQERIHQVRQKVRLSKAAKDLLSKARERDGYKALAERRKRALRPFAEAYYSSARTLRGDRAMSAVVQSHRVGLLSEQSDGQFGYLPIKAFRNARAAYDAIPEEEREKERR